jgi:pimeloyl-ACP methyl ester carboxylesterase/DNA-binding CsgD family transcriptional regulator
MAETRYCTTDDGVRIAYCVEGTGPPLVFVHFVYAFSLSHLVPTYDEAIHRIGRGRQLIRFDMRGAGLSQRNVDDVSPAATLRDLEAVVAVMALEQFTLLASAYGGPRCIEYAARYPAKLAGLVLYESYTRLTEVFPVPVLQAISQLARANWQLAARTLTDAGIRRDDEQEGLRWSQMMQQSTSGETLARLIESHLEYDVAHLLPQVQCPTLVCHSRNDALIPFELGQRLAEVIPNARLIPLEGEPRGPFTNAQSAIDAMETFLPSSQRAPVPASEVADEMREVPLTPREISVLRLVAAGRTSRQIADELSLSIRTIGRHITNIYGKISANGRADATSYALRHGITKE